MRAGDPGVRLLHPQPGEYDYAHEIPASFTRRDGQWQLIVLPRLFGGEEMSSRAAPIEERAAPATLSISADDAQRLGVADGASLTLQTDGGRVSLPLRLDSALPAGIVGVPAGLDAALVSGAWATLFMSPEAGSHSMSPESGSRSTSPESGSHANDESHRDERPNGGEERP